MRAGQWIVIGMLSVAVVTGVSVYYLQNFFFYDRVTDVSSIQIGDRDFAVSEYDGLDNRARPLRLRGCFKLADPEGALAAGSLAPDAAPFDAPEWFECWDAAAIDADLKSGAAQAVLAESTTANGFTTERLVAIYPDGRAYQWRRIFEDDG
ncbi:MAG: DUF6446 family protein [Pseudomonadota bacterium]